MADEENKPDSPAVAYERSADFVSFYANSVMFENSAWDLKLIFGQLDQSSTPNRVKQHLAVTIPWPQVKLAQFWIRVQVLFAEASINAKIQVRKDLLPPELPPLKPDQESDPSAKEFAESYRKAREEFLMSLQ